MTNLGKLRPEVKAEWIAALRSGEYEQGRLYLRRDDQFCCLGVLCDLAVKAGVSVTVMPALSTEAGAVAYDGAADFPPAAVRDWAYEEAPPQYRAWHVVDPEPTDNALEALSDLNDERDLSFAEIADLIEESL